ncbi:hypothetical protein MSMEI_6259 [Mycolicibacterium smegmatis MC2 155]|jgi:hypothetical protein|uniref:Uncharacterized protein n=4 Tax=Mycolicibacterium smegmatis TaxID=1772 RepID=I7FMY3_MYCS2|nr:hypothetical protein MSMEI_6259 [Mycolicibacterium smegmatis MC2 155]
MIGVTPDVVTELTGGPNVDRAGQECLMASQPMGSGSALPQPEWHTSGHLQTRHQMVAFLRACVIAAILLGVLAFIVWF